MEGYEWMLLVFATLLATVGYVAGWKLGRAAECHDWQEATVERGLARYYTADGVDYWCWNSELDEGEA